MPKILLIIPTDGGMHEQLAVLAANFSQRTDVEFVTIKGSPVDAVRNNEARLINANPDFTHLMTIDSDTVPPVDCVDRLLELDSPIATGCTPLKDASGLRWALSISAINGVPELMRTLPPEPFEVLATGASCLLIRREVIERLEFPWFKTIENPDGSGQTEDFFFSQKCREGGFKIRADPAVRCRHFKEVDLLELMNLLQLLSQQIKDLKNGKRKMDSC